MKVTFVLNSTNAGGAEVHALRLASHFSERHEVRVIALKEPSPLRALDTGGLRVSHCPEQGLWGQRRWLGGVLEDAKDGVVISVNLMPMVMVQSSRKVHRHLTIFHSFPDLALRQGFRAGFSTLCLLAAGTLMASRVARFVYVSSTQQRAWRMIPPFLFRSSVVIRNGVPVPAVVRAKSIASAMRIAMVAAFRKEKNHALLLDALLVLRERGVPFEVVFAGDGPLRSDIERRVRDLGLGSCVRFLGSLKDCSDVYQWADVTVLPSTAETLSLVIAESMSFATPVVASDVGGNREIIASGDNGYLFPSGDVESLVAALLRLATLEQRHQFGIRARQKMIEEFAIERMFAAYDTQL